MESKRPYVNECIARGVLPGNELLARPVLLDSIGYLPDEVVVLTPDIAGLIQKKHAVNWLQLDRLRALYEHGRPSGYLAYIQCFGEDTHSIEAEPERNKPSETPDYYTNVNILSSYDKPPRNFEESDFVRYFNQRYHMLERILRSRPELQGVISISRVLKKTEKEHVSIIGMVIERSETKNGNIMITLEDPTGRINVIVNKTKSELYPAAKDIVPDEVIGVTGVCGTRIIFTNTILWPDVPYDRTLKKAPDDVYAIFLSDIHVGSNNFLMKEFMRFIKWINCKSGTPEQREIASKVRYIFMVGDLVDGIGIYPDQDKELTIKDIYEQYAEFARLTDMIPHYIKVIVCPGNHDALRLSEPQPKLDPDFAKPVYQLPHVVVVSNPSLINIHSRGDFDGINILLYHGYSFDHYVRSVDSIRNADPTNRKNCGYHRADLIMKFLLKRRHLAPTHESTLHIPDTETDPLVITTLPDIFVTGHIHYALVANYRCITMISGSCWQSCTSFQEKMGHEPEPARVPVINLKTRQARILQFG